MAAFDFSGMKAKSKLGGLSSFSVGVAEGDVITNIPVDMLDSFDGQPFKMYSSERMEELKESIQNNGLLQPIVVTRKDNGRYLILAGHNRVQAHREIGYTEIKAVVKTELSQSEAKLIMLDTNLCQRLKLSVKERTKAYVMKHEALRDLGYSNATAIISKENAESKRSVQRYLALGRLEDDLLDRVDKEEINIKTGVNLSSLDKESQRNLEEYISENKVKLNETNSAELKEAAADKVLTTDDIADILEEPQKKKKAPTEIKIKYADIKDKLYGLPIDEVRPLIDWLFVKYTDEVREYSEGAEYYESPKSPQKESSNEDLPFEVDEDFE